MSNSLTTFDQSLSVCFPTEPYPKLDWHLSQPWYPSPPHISSCPKLNCCPWMSFVSTWPKPAFASGFWLMSTLECSIPRQLEPSVNSFFSALDDTCLLSCRISALYSRTVTPCLGVVCIMGRNTVLSKDFNLIPIGLAWMSLGHSFHFLYQFPDL